MIFFSLHSAWCCSTHHPLLPSPEFLFRLAVYIFIYIQFFFLFFLGPLVLSYPLIFFCRALLCDSRMIETESESESALLLPLTVFRFIAFSGWCGIQNTLSRESEQQFLLVTSDREKSYMAPNGRYSNGRKKDRTRAKEKNSANDANTAFFLCKYINVCIYRCISFSPAHVRLFGKQQ